MLWSGSVRLVCGLAVFVVAYFLIAFLGLFPTNTNFVAGDATAEGSETVYVRSSGVHADVIVPVESKTINWRPYFPRSDFELGTTHLKHIAFGWGDRGFYLETPTWNDLTISTTARAILLPSDSVMHVTFTKPVESDSCKSVVVSHEQYQRLVDHILASFVLTPISGSSKNTGDGNLKPSPIEAKYSYHWNDRFYEANGSYHAFSTCNCWVGRALKRAGVRTAWFTPLPRTVFVHWPGKKRGWHWLLPPFCCWQFFRQRKSTALIG